MARDQGIETGLQRLSVQGAAQAQGGGQVVSAAARIQAPEEPLALLGKRQRNMLKGLAGRRDRQTGDVHALADHLLIKRFALGCWQLDEAFDQVGQGFTLHH
ncbi:hypothetical protein D3C81_415270 [compost metagenome]